MLLGTVESPDAATAEEHETLLPVPPGTMWIYPSKLGLGLGAMCGMFYVVALQSRSGLMFLILGILVGCFVINAVACWRSARCLTVVPPPSMTGTEGEPVRGAWTVENASSRPIGLTGIRGPWGELLRFGCLGGNARAHITPALVFPSRGVYSFSSLAVVSSYPYGLIRCYRQLDIAGEITVYPEAYDCPPPPAAGFEPMVGGKYAGMNRSASGDSFHGVRPIEPRDPVKLIHWPSSSKGLGLMVKEFDEELSGRVGIVHDPGGGSVAGGETVLDWSARAVASMMFSALDEGHQVEYVSLGDMTPYAVPPFSDGDALLGHLARLRGRRKELTVEEVAAAMDCLPRKASLCFVLACCPAAVGEYLAAECAYGGWRKIAVYLPLDVRPPDSWTARFVCYGPHEMQEA